MNVVTCKIYKENAIMERTSVKAERYYVYLEIRQASRDFNDWKKIQKKYGDMLMREIECYWFNCKKCLDCHLVEIDYTTTPFSIVIREYYDVKSILKFVSKDKITEKLPLDYLIMKYLVEMNT
ncbi:MAG: hypothetical protein ACTSRA_00475 [Promethearchaeota archaeon]|nr:MAG: hypothetical protein [Helarchaeota virus Nidhogg Meg22_1012]URC17431.1 MAG: hypothetical protein [Helarchaeota virus Nidhogg Meg22_1214]